MKKNKLLVAVTTTRIYEYLTDAETEDIALDSFCNDSTARRKLISNQGSTYEIQEFIINKPTTEKK